MMCIEQLSIFIENRPGRMAEITGLLAANKIDIRALSIADTTDYGILRLIVSDPALAQKVLREDGVTVSITKVIAIAIPDVPGGLHQAVEVLNAADIEIEYMYAFLNPRKDTAFVIIRVEDNDKAVEVLTKGGIRLMRNEEICTL